MNILCWFKHKWVPVKGFFTTVVDNNDTPIDYKEVFTGHQCKRCSDRKIEKKNDRWQTPKPTQEAYDWLNEKIQKTKSATILTLAKK